MVNLSGHGYDVPYLHQGANITLGLAELTRDSVLQAMNEYSRLGRDHFLQKYGFGKAQDYFLLQDATSYDSKAIAGAAHGYLPGKQPLRREAFHGGKPVIHVLTRLGFEVVSQDVKTIAIPAASNSHSEVERDEDKMPDTHKYPLNQILYGPPGTGKTWTTSRLAVEICRGSAPIDRTELMAAYNDLVRMGRVAFTTFHQSIGYEEFVEGLRPTTDSDDDRDADGRLSGGFRLEPRKGIFREICALAEQARKSGGRPVDFDFTGRHFFKMSLGIARTESHIYDAAIKGSYIALGWGGDVDWSDKKYDDLAAVADRWHRIEPEASKSSGNISQLWRFRSSIKKGDIVIVSDGNSRFRAIGEVVGEYQYHRQSDGYNHRRSVRWLTVLDESLPIEIVYDGKLSQASCYQLSSNRIKLEALGAQVRDPASSSSETQSFVLIIDEINRANVSKVLGELITLLEPDKRLGERNALTVKLPYSSDEFRVPANLFVIGTMNTADRSIALLDTALRRRFHFTHMPPDYLCLDNKVVSGINLGILLLATNRRVEWLFDRDHQIGHSYFIDVEDKVMLDRVMQGKVIPLLVEYFYDDWEKVRGALNDSGQWFIGVETLPIPPMLKEKGEERFRYTINRGEIPIEGYLSTSSQQ